MRRTYTPPSVNTILHKRNSEFRKIVGGVDAMEELAAFVRRLVQPSLASHIRSAVLRGPILTVFADTEAFATKLRFEQPNLIASLATAYGNEITSVRIAVFRDEEVAGPPPPKRVIRERPDDVSLKCIATAADATSDDPDLSRSLKRLYHTLMGKTAKPT